MADIPKIRFKGFTEPWEQRKLGEICSRVQGNDGRMELPTLTISAANGWMKQEDRFSGNIAGKEQKNYTLLHKGELSYNHGNSKLAKYGTVFSLQTYEEALVPRVYHSFKVEIGSADFIEYYFSTKMPDRELRKLISSGARMDGLLNIGYDDFMGIKMMFPSVLEQDKIAEYFRAFDHLITLHQRKCDDTKELKKYMLQKMFPKNGEKFPEIRFKGFTEAWEQRKFQDVVEVAYQGINTTADKVEYINKGVPILQGKHITSGKIDYKDVRYLDKEKYEPIYYPKYVPKANDILLANIGTIGPSVVMEHGVELLIAWNIMLIRLNEKADVKFVKVFLDKLNNSNFYESIMRGNATKFINKEGIMNIEIPYPSVCEQQKIGAYFANLDHLITLHRRAL